MADDKEFYEVKFFAPPRKGSDKKRVIGIGYAYQDNRQTGLCLNVKLDVLPGPGWDGSLVIAPRPARTDDAGGGRASSPAPAARQSSRPTQQRIDAPRPRASFDPPDAGGEPQDDDIPF